MTGKACSRKLCFTTAAVFFLSVDFPGGSEPCGVAELFATSDFLSFDFPGGSEPCGVPELFGGSKAFGGSKPFCGPSGSGGSGTNSIDEAEREVARSRVNQAAYRVRNWP